MKKQIEQHMLKAVRILCNNGRVNQAQAARILSTKKDPISSARFNMWVKGHVPVPMKYAIQIERKTQGAVSVAMLRPDIFAED